MAKKTICDVCGTECTTVTGRLSLKVEHRTTAGDLVGEDFFIPVDLCGEHTDAARLRYQLRVSQGERITGEEAMIIRENPVYG